MFHPEITDALMFSWHFSPNEICARWRYII